MDTYQEAYMNAHMGTLELIADMASTTLSGLETAFTDILTGAKNAKDAFPGSGKGHAETIAKLLLPDAVRDAGDSSLRG